MGVTIRLSTLAVASLAAFGADAQQMTAVTWLGWLRNGEHAPIMMAEAKGFFKDKGIDHKIVDGGLGKNPIPIVAVGQAQFGLATNGMTVVTARLVKDLVDVVAIVNAFARKSGIDVSKVKVVSAQAMVEPLCVDELGCVAKSVG